MSEINVVSLLNWVMDHGHARIWRYRFL